MELVSTSPRETELLAGRVFDALTEESGTPGTATILALQGELGAGKTAFTKGLAQAAGVQEMVTSPTYVIEKIYPLPEESRFSRLIHIDAYRLDGAEELHGIGWYEAATDPKNLIVIEWPEQVGLGVPERAYWCTFEHVAETVRKITIDERLTLPE